MFMTGDDVGIILDDAAYFYLGGADPLTNNIIMEPDVGISIGSSLFGDLGLTSRRSMTLEASDSNSIELRCVSTICTGDLNVQTINGLPPGSGGTTVSTFFQLYTSSIYVTTVTGRTTDIIGTEGIGIYSGLDLYSYAETDIAFVTSTGSIVLKAGLSELPVGLTSNSIYALADKDIGLLAYSTVVLTANNLNDVLYMNNGIDLATSNSLVIYSDDTTINSSTIHMEVSSVTRLLGPSTRVPQPVIQTGDGAGGPVVSGYVMITMDYDYNDANNYNVFIQGTTNGIDIPSTYIPYFNVTKMNGTQFEVYWTNSSADNMTEFCWTAMGVYGEIK
jgi:hypothetical protein